MIWKPDQIFKKSEEGRSSRERGRPFVLSGLPIPLFCLFFFESNQPCSTVALFQRHYLAASAGASHRLFWSVWIHWAKLTIEVSGVCVRIDRLTLTNYKGFASRIFEFNPLFNLFVGENATGKTSILDALTLAMDSWFIGMKAGEGIGGIRSHEVRFATHQYEDSISFEAQYPSVVEARGLVMEEELSWTRELSKPGGRTTTAGAKELTAIAAEADRKVREGIEVDLPLVCSYGAERLWYETPHRSKKADDSAKLRPSRFDGYLDCTAFEIQETVLLKWIEAEISVSLQKGSDTNALSVVKKALVNCVDGAETVYYDPRIEDLVVVMGRRGHQIFHNLSAGQRIMVILIGDLARRAVTLILTWDEMSWRKSSGSSRLMN